MYFVFHYRTLDRERARAIQQHKREEQSGKSLTVCLLFEKEYSGTPPYDHPVYKTTSLLRPYSFKPKVKNIDSFSYFEDPVNATTSLLRPGFYGPTVVILMGFHCMWFFQRCVFFVQTMTMMMKIVKKTEKLLLTLPSPIHRQESPWQPKLARNESEVPTRLRLKTRTFLLYRYVCSFLSCLTYQEAVWMSG